MVIGAIRPGYLWRWMKGRELLISGIALQMGVMQKK